jgi:hypothetical protein
VPGFAESFGGDSASQALAQTVSQAGQAAQQQTEAAVARGKEGSRRLDAPQNHLARAVVESEARFDLPLAGWEAAYLYAESAEATTTAATAAASAAGRIAAGLSFENL